MTTTSLPRPTQATSQRPAIVIDSGGGKNDPYLVMQRQKRVGKVLAWVIPISLLALWEVSSRNGWIDSRTFASPFEVFHAAVDMTASGALWEDLSATLRRIGIGYVAGAVLGILAGTALGWWVLARTAFRPMIQALQTIPMLGIFPLFMLIFGMGEFPKYLMIAKGLFVLTALGTLDAVAGVPTSYIEAAKSMGASRWAMFKEVVMPAAMGGIITALRIGIGAGVLSTIGVEFIAANEGVGSIIWTSWNLFLPADMFVGIILSCLVGVAANMLVDLLQRAVMPWRRDGDRVVS